MYMNLLDLNQLGDKLKKSYFEKFEEPRLPYHSLQNTARNRNRWYRKTTEQIYLAFYFIL